MNNYIFKIVVEDDEHEDGRPAFRVYCPALESIGAATWGNTREEAVKHIGEVLHMIVEELAKEGKEIPPEPVRGAWVRMWRLTSPHAGSMGLKSCEYGGK